MKNPKISFKIIVAFLGAVIGIPCHYAYHAYKDILVTHLHRAQTASGNLFEQTVYASQADRAFAHIGEFTAFIPTITRKRRIARPMASGKTTYRGAIACPEWFDFGTRIEIENVGIFTCEDRMAEAYRDKNNFDILVADYDNAMEFGRQQLRYRVL
jgi:3D (Asp-Asp-Asp) domain-containing protein